MGMVQGGTPVPVYVRGGTAEEDFYLVERVTTAGVTTLIPSPGLGHEIIIRQIQVQSESAQQAITAVLMRGGIPRWRIYMPSGGDGFCLDCSPGNHWVIGDNTPFQIQLSVADAVGVCISYSIRRSYVRV